MKPGRALGLCGCVAIFAALGLHSGGCGDSQKLPVVFDGNVSSVEGGSADLQRSGSNRSFLVRVNLGGLLGREAIAQSAACASATQEALGDVFACSIAASLQVLTPTPTATASPTPTGTRTPAVGTPTLTPTGIPTATRTPIGDARIRCSRVNERNCEFQTEIRLTEDGEPASVFFFLDEDGDDRPADDGSELEAVLANFLPELCNGDVILLEDVDIDFLTGLATASSATKTVDACGKPRTPTRTPTPPGTPATATPTRTGTPPTSTPTRTGTPATATPTPTTGCLPNGSSCSGSQVPCCPPLSCGFLTGTCNALGL